MVFGHTRVSCDEDDESNKCLFVLEKAPASEKRETDRRQDFIVTNRFQIYMINCLFSLELRINMVSPLDRTESTAAFVSCSSSTHAHQVFGRKR